MHRRQSVRITPLGYIVLSIIIIVMLVGIYFIIWSMGSAGRQGAENMASSAVTITPTPSLAPMDGTGAGASAAPEAAPQQTEAPTQAPVVTEAPTQAPASTPKPDDTPVPDAKTPSPAQVQSAVDGTLLNGGVVLRKGPAGTYDILGKYSSGTRLKIYAREGDYYFVMVVQENKYGYMAVKFIEKNGLLPGETATPTPKVPDGVIPGKVNASTVALRSGPSKDSKAVCQLERGDGVYIYFKTGEFYYIATGDGTKCYAFAQYILPEITNVPEGTPVP